MAVSTNARQRDIAAAILARFHGSGITTRQHAARSAIVIDVAGMPDPIIVLSDDVLIPSSLPAGISDAVRLDLNGIYNART